MTTNATSSTLASLLSLAGQTAIVTGGAKGIGRAIVERLAEAGATVTFTDVDVEAGAALAESSGTHFIRADASSAADAARVVSDVVTATGRIDILVNNAGVFPMRPALDIDEALWDRVLDINLKGAFFMAQAAAKAMVEGGAGKNGRGGSIINIASIDALHPSGNLVHYDASKGGMVMMTKSLALELGKHHIRVNVICPGSIKTPGADAISSTIIASLGITPEQMAAGFLARVPLGRTGAPEDIANATLFLSSTMASYVTGDVMVVDGGYLLS
jgi:2-deoxy-D-gluconate 3-dehydrogenase